MSVIYPPSSPQTIGPLAHQLVLNNMREGLIVVDNAGRVVEHNPAAETLLALDRQASQVPLAEATLDRALGAALANMLAIVSNGSCEREIVVQVPQPRTLQISASALADTSGGQLGTLFMIRDVSEQADRVKSAILDTISHEFRTPITTILGFTELYQEQVLGPVTAEQQEALEAVSRGAHRLLKLVDDLLDLARLEAGKLDMSLHPVDVQLCIKEATALVAPQFEQKRLKLRTEIDDHLPFVAAEAMWLRRVLINLLTNALRFTNEGEVLVRAYELNERHAEKLRQIAIEIADTGIGIVEEEQHTIFEAFQRAEGVQAQIPNSSGLGLAISQRVIEQMNGQITLDSRAGHGSTFTIMLRACELELEHPSSN